MLQKYHKRLAMQGIMFIEPLTIATMEGRKTRTSRVIDPPPDESGRITFKPRYKIGEVLYIKEPYVLVEPRSRFAFDGVKVGKPIYKYGGSWGEKNWQNKQGMPARFARTFIKITGVRTERLQDITEQDAIREGVEPFGSISGKWVCYDKAQCRMAAKMDGYVFCGSARASFSTLWDSLAKPGRKWEDNPWVGVYDYELTTKPE